MYVIYMYVKDGAIKASYSNRGESTIKSVREYAQNNPNIVGYWVNKGGNKVEGTRHVDIDGSFHQWMKEVKCAGSIEDAARRHRDFINQMNFK